MGQKESIMSPFNNTRIYLSILIIFLFSACNKEAAPLYLNNETDQEKLQQKVEELAETLQIDSLCIRATSQGSLMTSIYILGTNSDKEDKNKSMIEYLPSQKMTLKHKSNVEKDALHSYKFNLKNILPYIEQAKNQLPDGYKYQDIKSISYSANPFEEKYFFDLEIIPSDGIYKEETNEYISHFYKAGVPSTDNVGNMGNVYFAISFMVENGNLQMLKSK